MSGPAGVSFDHVPPGWEALVAADPSASPSHRPEVWDALAGVLPGSEWRVLAHHEAGLLLGGAPVLLVRRGPFRWLHALPWLLPAAPLARPGAHARVDAAVCGAFARLASEQRVLGGEWSFYRPEGPEPEEAALARVPGETRRFEAAVLRLEGGPDRWGEAMSRKQRQAIEHARKRGFAFAEEPRALDEAYALHLEQSRGWSGHRPLPLELSRRLLRESSAASGPAARLFTLRSRHDLISAALALDGPHETFVWWSGTHRDGRRADAFALLIFGIAEWAASRGRRRLDLGASTGLSSVASFKRSLGADGFRYPVRWLDARHAQWPGRVLAAIQFRVRRGRARGEAA